MRIVRDLLRLSAAGMSKRKIAASVEVSATAALDCIGRARCAGLSRPPPEGLTDEMLGSALRAAFDGDQGSSAAAELVAVHRELRRPGIGLQLSWEEHLVVYPDGYDYRRFRELHRAREARLSPAMR
jgi:transposase